MAFACVGKCGDAACGKTYDTEQKLRGHLGFAAMKRKTKAAATPPTGGPAPAPGFYPPLLSWTQETTKAEPPKTGPTPPAPPPVPMFPTAPIWKAVGEIADEVMFALKGKKPFNITDEKAKMLDASIQASGFVIQPNPNPVAVPWWAPLAGAFVTVFVFPAALMFLPDIKTFLENFRKKDGKKPTQDRFTVRANEPPRPVSTGLPAQKHAISDTDDSGRIEQNHTL